MENQFFMNHFDIKTYVNQRMLEIEDLQERNIYKDLTEKILVDLFEYQTKSYQTLYENVAEELKSEKVPCCVQIGLTRPEKYDASDQFLFPMDYEDTTTKEHSTETILDEEIGWSQRIYIQGTYWESKNFYSKNKVISGKIITDSGEFPAKFQVKPAVKYMELLKKLRTVFAGNGKPWSTVCTAHLERMYEVSLLLDFEIPVLGELQEISVDYSSCTENILENVFPLWNISRITQTTSSYPTPALDKINYEHQIFAHRLKADCTYLAENREVQISSIYFKNGDLLICSQTPTPIQWELLEITSQTHGIYEFPVFSNQYNTGFTDVLKYYHRSHVKTKQELKRFLSCLPYGDKMSFTEMELSDTLTENHENYDMDSFILDEIRSMSYKKAMVLTFEAKEEVPLFETDILSFLVTQVQGLFPEYYCVGRVNKESI